MSDPQFRSLTTDDRVADALEHAGAFVAAAGKTLRFGYLAADIVVRQGERSTNLASMRREAEVLRTALDLLEAQLAAAFGK